MPASPHRPLARVLLIAALAAASLAACGGGGSSAGDDRAAQVRAAATKAGLPGEVADVLALASRGPTSTFRVTYQGTDGASIVISQDAPDRRVDVRSHGQVVSSRVSRHGVGYRCDVDTTARAAKAKLTCQRAAGDLPATGSFTTAALRTFTEQLVDSRDRLDLTVTHKTIAGTKATCLVSGPKAGTTLTGDDDSVDTLCVSAEGAQLLVDANGQRLVAEHYATRVPDGTFDV